MRNANTLRAWSFWSNRPIDRWWNPRGFMEGTTSRKMIFLVEKSIDRSRLVSRLPNPGNQYVDPKKNHLWQLVSENKKGTNLPSWECVCVCVKSARWKWVHTLKHVVLMKKLLYLSIRKGKLSTIINFINLHLNSSTCFSKLEFRSTKEVKRVTETQFNFTTI